MANSSLLGSYGDNIGSSMMFRNKLINGTMNISQRYGTASTSLGAAAFAFAVDRWLCENSTSAGVCSVQQVVDAPAGLLNSVKWTVTTIDNSLTATESAFMQQSIEGLNCIDLGFGTAAAKTVTLSFWVKSSVTGTFGGALANNAYNRGQAFTFTINAANTWEYKTVSISGDSTGTWLVDNGIGLRVSFALAAGSSRSATAGSWGAGVIIGATGQTNLFATLNATFQITGVQLEAGPVATPFEQRPIGMELALCQRYCERIDNASGQVGTHFCWGLASSTTNVNFIVPFAVPKRVVPTAFLHSGSGTFQAADGVTGHSITALNPSTTSACTTSAGVGATTSGVTQYRSYFLQTVNGQTPYLIFSAEL